MACILFFKTQLLEQTLNNNNYKVVSIKIKKNN